MDNPKAYGLFIALGITLIVFNAIISKDIFNWVPNLKKQVYLWILVWFLPFIGFFIANKVGNLGWFKPKGSSSGESTISGGFMEADAVFNPGARNHIEMVEKQKTEIHHEHKQAGSNDGIVTKGKLNT